MTKVNMDLNMETVIIHTELTWNLHVNANSGTQFCICLRIVFYMALIICQIKLSVNEDVLLSLRRISAYDCLCAAHPQTHRDLGCQHGSLHVNTERGNSMLSIIHNQG